MKLSFTLVLAFVLSTLFFTADAQQVVYTRYQKHEVQAGETAAQIAKKYNLALTDFCLLNDYPENIRLKEGTIVLIRALAPGEMEVEENLPAKKERKIVRTEDAITYEEPVEKKTETKTTTTTTTREKTVVKEESAPVEKTEKNEPAKTTTVVKSEPVKTTTTTTTTVKSQPAVVEEKPGITPASTKAVEVGPGGTKYNVSQSDYHVVAKGQTFYRIALIYGLTVQELQEINGLSNTTIEIGQKLKVRK